MLKRFTVLVSKDSVDGTFDEHSLNIRWTRWTFGEHSMNIQWAKRWHTLCRSNHCACTLAQYVHTRVSTGVQSVRPIICDQLILVLLSSGLTWGNSRTRLITCPHHKIHRDRASNYCQPVSDYVSQKGSQQPSLSPSIDHVDQHNLHLLKWGLWKIIPNTTLLVA